MKPLIYKTISQEFELNGHKVTATINIKTMPDDFDIENDMDFETEEQKQELLDKLNRSQIEVITIMVDAYAEGCEGNDSLGQCFISSGADIDEIVSGHEMIHNAIKTLKDEMIFQADNLKKYLE